MYRYHPFNWCKLQRIGHKIHQNLFDSLHICVQTLNQRQVLLIFKNNFNVYLLFVCLEQNQL
jgi:hypothetical protein